MILILVEVVLALVGAHISSDRHPADTPVTVANCGGSGHSKPPQPV